MLFPAHRIFLCTILTILTLAPITFGQEKVFRAGAYAQDITPANFPVSVNGGMSDRKTNGSHDTLHARCLALDDGSTKIVIVVVDSCMIPREITDGAKKLAFARTKVPADHILISATHTHTAPTVTGVFQSDPNKDYQKYLTKKIAEGIEKAVANLEPARIGWGVGQNSDQIFNRRWLMKADTLNPDPFDKNTDLVRMNPGYQNPGLSKPAGPIDPDVSVLAVQAKDGRPIALLANYSLHYVGGVQPLSADYFGAFAERMTQLLKVTDAKPAFVGIMSNGTSGDINNVNYGGPAPKRREPYEQIRVVANDVAATAFAAYKKIQYKDWVSLDMAQKELELGVRLPTKKDLTRANKILADARNAKKKVLTTRQEIYARESVLLAKYPAKVKLLVQAMRIGDLGIVSTPCETFAEIGLDIKNRSPLKHTFTIELANGYNGYLPTPRQHKLGGYETWRARSSYLEVNASVPITKAIMSLLEEVSRSK